MDGSLGLAKLKQESIVDFLQCASILEERAYLLYRSLADKVNLPLINSLLLHIAFDSRKHSVLLKGLCESTVKTRKQPKDCQEKLFFGRTWTIIERLVGDIAKNERIPRERMSSLVEKLMLLERTVGEKYYVLVQLKTLRYMTREIRELYNVDIEDLKDILETIIRDEEIHRELLSKMKKILVGLEKQTEDVSPAVKYKNLDSWSRSMPNAFCENSH